MKLRVFANLQVKTPSSKIARERAIHVPIAFLLNIKTAAMSKSAPNTMPEIKDALLAAHLCPRIPPIKMHRAYAKTTQVVFFVFMVNFVKFKFF